MLILFFNHFLSVISGLDFLSSATIRYNKLYTIHQDIELGYANCKVYELNEGPIIDIVNNSKTYYLTQILKGFKLVFLDIPDNFQDSRNKLWMRAELSHEFTGKERIEFTNWVGYINLDDMSLKRDSNFIKFPEDENFPISNYTVNNLANIYELALYITEEK
jgi:hypothetical protein